MIPNVPKSVHKNLSEIGLKKLENQKISTMSNQNLTWWATAAELVHKIMASTSILTGVGAAVINIEFTVLALETFGTLTTVGSNQIPTGGTILAGS